MKPFLLFFTISAFLYSNSHAQVNGNDNSLIFKETPKTLNLILKETLGTRNALYNSRIIKTILEKKDYFSNPSLRSYSFKDKTQITSSTLPIALGVAGFLYLLNPIVLFENDKIALGITKEISLGFGYFGQHRASFEYSYIFRKDLNSFVRLGYKYDILLEPGLEPSHLLQGTPVISVGGGVFTNFSHNGYFAESSYGYSIRNDKFLFYPSAKLRFTYIHNGANIIDFSFGIIIGLANPFIDLKIRRTY